MTRKDVAALVVGAALLAGIVWVVVPSPVYREFGGHRPVCSSNLGGTGKGFATYATANNDWWPTPAHKASTATRPGGEVTYVRRIGAKRGRAGVPEAGATSAESIELSATRSLWMLIRTGASSPRSFICPDSSDAANEDENPTDYWDFGTGDQVSEGMGQQDPAANWLQVSYGYQLPFGTLGKPNGDADNDMVMAADKGPFSAFLDAAKGGDPGVPVGTGASSPEEWRKWNSPNHDGEGQNVMYPDAHVEWRPTPLAGVNKDNIYTQWSSFSPDENGRVRGKPPTLAGREVPMGETDTLLYP